MSSDNEIDRVHICNSYRLDPLWDSETIDDDISIAVGHLRNTTWSDINQSKTDVDSLMFGLGNLTIS